MPSLSVDGAQRSTDNDVGGVSGAVQVDVRLEGEQRLVAGLAALHLDQTGTRVDARGRTGDLSAGAIHETQGGDGENADGGMKTVELGLLLPPGWSGWKDRAYPGDGHTRLSIVAPFTISANAGAVGGTGTARFERVI